ncbi:DegT/DnrJ/EryC1/StrS family aminotransferase [Tellurirhabdus bombi]|uniref:DegT/DnrJ/EryC1/StrS family aminotransferase n=1 Tax=Tellurirhabdus bombi TaxID=2907205 RepID=UPI00272E0C23|nr:DegT/DnrJ/EryC1/StrS aminotransferase family protein [Tellurirhabdus bombi]
MAIRNIPVYQPSLTGNEKKYVIDCLDSTWISSKGKYINEFEHKFANYLGAHNAVTVSNGTVALHLAMVALGIGPEDEVIVPTLTYIASVNAIVYEGATPVFVDSEADSWQMDPEDVIRKITPKTKAILCVHLYGHPCDMDRLTAIANEHGLFLIEDCAEAIGTQYKGRLVGSFGDIATFSFYGNKTITTGEGGMVVTNNETLHDRCLHFRGQGLAKYRQYWHDVIGYNYRMTNICAAIGLAQLEQLDHFLSQKQQIAAWYAEGLEGTSYETHRAIGDVVHSYWMCSILVKRSEDRDGLRDHLQEHGIETRPLFYPVHTMPMYSHKYARHKTAEDLGWRGMNVPSYPGLSREEVQYITDTIKSYPIQ